MTVTKLHHSGAWQVSEIVNGYLLTRTYYGYTKRESISNFNKEKRNDRKSNHSILCGGRNRHSADCDSCRIDGRIRRTT